MMLCCPGCAEVGGEPEASLLAVQSQEHAGHAGRRYLRTPARSLPGFLHTCVAGGLALSRVPFAVVDTDEEKIGLETREAKQVTKRGK
jgi:hypothetical protein